MDPSFQRINKAALAKLIAIFVVITGLLTLMSWAIIWFFFGFFGSAGSPLSASGQVLDAYTEEPIPNVEVRLIVGEQPAIHHTNLKGEYRIEARQAGASRAGRLTYYHPDYRPLQLPFSAEQLAQEENAPWASVKLAPLAGDASPDPDLLQKISALRQSYDRRRNALTRELREIQEAENPNLETQKREVNLKGNLRLLEAQKRFLIEDSLAYQLREIDRAEMLNQLEKWEIEIKALQ